MIGPIGISRSEATSAHRMIADAGHFLQEDKGEELAHLWVDFQQRSIN